MYSDSRRGSFKVAVILCTAALVAYALLAVTAALEHDTPDSDRPDLVPVARHELLRLLRLLILPAPRHDADHGRCQLVWGAAA